VLGLRGISIFSLAVISDLVCEVVIGLINGSVDIQDGSNEVRLSENAYVTSDANSSSNSSRITYTLKRLNLSG